MKKILIFSTLILGLVLVGCGGSKSSSKKSTSTEKPKIQVSEAAKTEAKKIFTTTCAACHGVTGKGDGAASKALTPPPRNLTDGTWQESVDDAYIEQIIQYGGGAVGKSIAMPSNPALGGNEELLRALVEYIRSIKENKVE